MCAVRRPLSSALWGMCAADSVAMPVHWYYDVDLIHRDYGGWLRGPAAPRERHPTSILSLSDPAGSGRTAGSPGGPRPDVVGSVILHGKLHLWKTPSGHYHQGLRSGDNTLNVLCALRAARSLVSGGFRDVSGPEARAAVLSDYVFFLTAPGSHRDTYAESSHRSFFSSWRERRPTAPREVLAFAEERSRRMLNSRFPDGQLDAVGCLPMTLPFVLLAADEERAVSAAVEFVKLTHPHPKVPEYVSIYSRALHAVLGGASVQQQAERALKRLDAWEACRSYRRKAARFLRGSDEQLKVHQSAVSYLGLACYTKGSLSSLFYLAHEFHDDVRGGILANANCGGENCNRGAALGALLGAGGATIPQDWRDQLRDAQEFIPDILKDVEGHITQ